MDQVDRQLAERVRAACVHAALAAYEDAGSSGLCAEGRWEYAIGVLRQLDLGPLLRPVTPLDSAESEGDSEKPG